jgi:Cytochrome C assembly protein
VGFLSQVHLSCFALSYLAAFCCDALRLRMHKTSGLRWSVLVFTVAGLIAHTAWLIVRSQSDGLPPLVRSGQDWLLVLAWLGAVLSLALQVTHPGLPNGLFLLTPVLGLIVASLFASEGPTASLDSVVMRRWGMLHASSLVIGIGCVFVGSISALVYLLHFRRIRSHEPSSAWLPLPSLEQLSAVNRWMITASVPMLTVGMISGFMLIGEFRQTASTRSINWTDPTIIATMIVWAVMVLVLGRMLLVKRQSGKALAQLTLLSGCFLVITVLAPMLLSQGGAIDTFHGQHDIPATDGSREAAP